MPRYVSRYDQQPLVDDGADGGGGGSPPLDLTPKHLQLNRYAAAAMTSAAPENPFATDASGAGAQGGGSGNAGAGAHSGTGGDSGSSGGADAAAGAGHWTNPNFHHISVLTHDLLDLEQRLIDQASNLVSTYNDLLNSADSALSAEFWGMHEGSYSNDAIQGKNAGREGHLQQGTHTFHLSRSAESTTAFVQQLKTTQRIALQHTADAVALSGSFVDLLHASADVYGVADQHSAFPDKTALQQDH